MPERYLQAPQLVASMHESPLYGIMGAGLTDAIFLLGHADGLELNTPYQVTSIRGAMRDMNFGESTPVEINWDGEPVVWNGETATAEGPLGRESPLLRAMLEVYFAGARDIWLVAVAPMSEYEPDLSNRDTAYYQMYKDRLDDTYDILSKWDTPQLIVPLEAPFNSTVDFLGPLAKHCYETTFSLRDPEVEGYLKEERQIQIGILGTRGAIEQADIDAMIQDGRLDKLGNAGRHVLIFVGDVMFNFAELQLGHTTSAAAVVAAEIAQLPLNRGMTHRILNNVITTNGADLTTEQIEALANAKLNPVGRSTLGKRGNSFQVIAFTDNTLAQRGSDYSTLPILRLTAKVSNRIKAIGMTHIGMVGEGTFKRQVDDYLMGLAETDIIRGYQLSITRAPDDLYRLIVDVVLTPYGSLRQIHVPVTVGPNMED